jgi:hypothetical protein
MKLTKPLSCGLLFAFLIPTAVMAQAFGEYGRALGGATQKQGSPGANPLGGAQPHGPAKGGSQGLGDATRRSLPLRLVVAAKEAALYPRQDDEAEKMDRLLQGETLVPMVQIAGGNEWYMVKTQKGLIGWVKSSDVRTETGTKP